LLSTSGILQRSLVPATRAWRARFPLPTRELRLAGRLLQAAAGVFGIPFRLGINRSPLGLFLDYKPGRILLSFILQTERSSPLAFSGGIVFSTSPGGSVSAPRPNPRTLPSRCRGSLPLLAHRLRSWVWGLATSCGVRLLCYWDRRAVCAWVIAHRRRGPADFRRAPWA
jgi:hypothetical protein